MRHPGVFYFSVCIMSLMLMSSSLGIVSGTQVFSTSSGVSYRLNEIKNIPTTIPFPPDPAVSQGPYAIGWQNVSIAGAGVSNGTAAALIVYPALTWGENAPANKIKAPYTTVIFCPGYTGNKDQYFAIMWKIATWGYVITLVNFDTRTTPYPDTNAIVDHYTVAMDYLVTLNTTSSSTLMGMIDDGRFVCSGHSMGGGASVVGTWHEKRFKAGIALSPYITAPFSYVTPPDQAIKNITVPICVIVGSADTTAPPSTHADVVYANGNPVKYEFTITGMGHTWTPNTLYCNLFYRYYVSFLNYYMNDDCGYYVYLYGPQAKDDIAKNNATIKYDLGKTAAPQVIDHSPTGINVSLSTNITITFDERMNKYSAENSFSVQKSGSNITGAFSWTNYKMVFSPSVPLDPSTIYTVALMNGSMNYAGAQMISPFSFQFTTTASAVTEFSAMGLNSIPLVIFIGAAVFAVRYRKKRVEK